MASSSALPHTGFGTLGLTWRSPATPDEQAFAAMRAAVENGATIWSTSSVYGLPPQPPTAGIRLLRRYFEKFPEDGPKVTLFIRGCFDGPSHTPKTTRAEVRASWQECSDILGGFKSIDVFGPARIDPKVSLEETIGALKELLDEGKIGAVGLSEVRAETIQRASAICPIKFAEIEFSLWSTEMLDNGVAAAAKEHNVILLTYAPLGYGFLTGKVKKPEDIPEGDLRRHIGRFHPDNFYKNFDIVDKVNAIADKKGITSAQLALAWIRANSNNGVCGTLIPIPGATAAERVNENSKLVEISPREKEELDAIVNSFEAVGHRQVPGQDHFLWT